MGLEPFSQSSQKVNSELKGNRLRNCTNINQKFPSTAEWTNEMFHSHKNNKTKTVDPPPHIPLTEMPVTFHYCVGPCLLWADCVPRELIFWSPEPQDLRIRPLYGDQKLTKSHRGQEGGPNPGMTCVVIKRGHLDTDGESVM